MRKHNENTNVKPPSTSREVLTQNLMRENKPVNLEKVNFEYPEKSKPKALHDFFCPSIFQSREKS